MKSVDCIIIGGGIVGMSTANELRKQGADIAIFDRGQLGMEASWAAGGILSSMRPWAEAKDTITLSEYSKAIYPDYVEALKKDTNIDPEYINSGLVIVDKVHAEKTKRWAIDTHVNFSAAPKDRQLNIERSDDAVLLPDIAQVHPPKLIKALKKRLQNSSVSIYEHVEISKIETKYNQFQSVLFNGDKLSAESVIITAGAWSESILSHFQVKTKTSPIRGQMLCLKPHSTVTNRIILDDTHYLIPRKDGQLLVGSTMEDVGFVKETTKKGREELFDWATYIAPQLKNAKCVKHWAGLRPSTITSKPLIGKLANFNNVYLNSGHFRKGILQAPASAQLIVDTLLGRASFMEKNGFNFQFRV